MSNGWVSRGILALASSSVERDETLSHQVYTERTYTAYDTV